MKKMMMATVTFLMISLGLMGCSGQVETTKSYTFSIDNGDSIKITLDTSDGYDITSELPFEISKDDETLSQGDFITADGYTLYTSSARTDEMATVIEEGSTDDYSYIMWSYDDSEYNYAILIEDSDTGILLGNDVSEDSARECFSRLTIENEK